MFAHSCPTSSRLFGKLQHLTSADFHSTDPAVAAPSFSVRTSWGCFPPCCHSFLLGSGPESTFPTGVHTPTCNDLLAMSCAPPISVLETKWGVAVTHCSIHGPASSFQDWVGGEAIHHSDLPNSRHQQNPMWEATSRLQSTATPQFGEGK